MRKETTSSEAFTLEVSNNVDGLNKNQQEPSNGNVGNKNNFESIPEVKKILKAIDAKDWSKTKKYFDDSFLKSLRSRFKMHSILSTKQGEKDTSKIHELMEYFRYVYQFRKVESDEDWRKVHEYTVDHFNWLFSKEGVTWMQQLSQGEQQEKEVQQEEEREGHSEMDRDDAPIPDLIQITKSLSMSSTKTFNEINTNNGGEMQLAEFESIFQALHKRKLSSLVKCLDSSFLGSLKHRIMETAKKQEQNYNPDDNATIEDLLFLFEIVSQWQDEEEEATYLDWDRLHKSMVEHLNWLLSKDGVEWMQSFISTNVKTSIKTKSTGKKTKKLLGILKRPSFGSRASAP